MFTPSSECTSHLSLFLLPVNASLKVKTYGAPLAGRKRSRNMVSNIICPSFTGSKSSQSQNLLAFVGADVRLKLSRRGVHGRSRSSHPGTMRQGVRGCLSGGQWCVCILSLATIKLICARGKAACPTSEGVTVVCCEY
jgi:hypothetical protein